MADLPSLVPSAPVRSKRLLLRPMTVADVPAVAAIRARPEVHAYLSHGALSEERLDARLRLRVARMTMTSDKESSAHFVVELRDEGPGRPDITFAPAGSPQAPPASATVPPTAGESSASTSSRIASSARLQEPDGVASPSVAASAHLMTGRIVGDCGVKVVAAWTKDDAPTEHLVATINYVLAPECGGRGLGVELVGLLIDHVFTEPRVHRIRADVFADNLASRAVLQRNGFREEGYFVDDGIIDGAFVDACQYALLRREWLR